MLGQGAGRGPPLLPPAFHKQTRVWNGARQVVQGRGTRHADVVREGGCVENKQGEGYWYVSLLKSAVMHLVNGHLT